MATTNKSDKIYIGIDSNEPIELTGKDKQTFEDDRAQMRAEALLLETEYAAKQAARTSALTKLATIAGLTEEEMTSLGL